MVTLQEASNLLSKAREQLKPVIANVERILSPVTNFTRSNPLATGVILGIPSGAVGSSVVRKVTRSRKKKSKSTKSKSRSKRKRTKKAKSRNTRKSKKKTTKSSRKKIKYTKTGQPYILLASGKSRFISKKSAETRKKRKGGYH